MATVIELLKEAKTPDKSHAMRGRLILASSGWLLLEVPNSLARGVFDTIREPGIELPTHDGKPFNAHISVMAPKEIAELGGPEKITERGHEFSYTLGPLREVKEPHDTRLSRVWYVEIESPELKALRRSYGLSATPMGGDYQYHVTVACRRKNVLQTNDVSKGNSETKIRPFASNSAGSQVIKISEEQSPIVDLLLKAKAESDRRNYAAKHDILRKLIADSGQEFHVDDDKGKHPGITHSPSGFRMHAPRDVAAQIKQAMAARKRREKRGTVVKTANIGGYPISIDRPKGHLKTFQTPNGPVEKAYPVDYGYFNNFINPDDNEELDIFRGSGGPHRGRFMKGKNLSGKWEPDERKWYSDLTDEELEAVKAMFTEQSPDLLQDYQSFDDEESFLADVLAAAGQKQAMDAHTMVPTAAMDQVRKHGLLSGQSLLQHPEALAAAAKGRGMTPEELKQQLEETLAGWKAEGSQGVNVLFKGPPEGFKLPEHHPTKRWDMTRVGVDLSKLLKSLPNTRVHGSELVPYNAEDDERLGEDYIDQRHRDLSPEEIAELQSREDTDLWKDMDKDFKGYAANVPHASLITESGGIDPQYLQLPEKQAMEVYHGTHRPGSGPTSEPVRPATAGAAGSVAGIADEGKCAAVHSSGGSTVQHRDGTQQNADQATDSGCRAEGTSTDVADAAVGLRRASANDSGSDRGDLVLCKISVETATPSVRQAIAQAVRKVKEPKSQAQAEAGNYRKGHINMHGMRIAIENKRGGIRSGTDPGGKSWAVVMKHHYGYIKGTEGRDGDQIDVFVGPNPEAELVYVVDQVNPGGKRRNFDEHKCMLGFTTKKDAKEGYLANYAGDWQGLGNITPLTMGQFKEWLKDGDPKKPLAKQVFTVKTAEDDDDDDDQQVLIIRRHVTIRMYGPKGKLPPRDAETGEFVEKSEENEEKSEKITDSTAKSEKSSALRLGVEKQADFTEMMQAIVDPQVRKWLDSHGMVKGDFYGNRNLLDVMQDQQRQEDVQEALELGAQSDRPTYEKMLRGFSALTGQPWTPATQQYAETMSGQFAEVTPYLQRWAPKVFNKLHGGSVASLTRSITEAGQKQGVTPPMAHRQAQAIIGRVFPNGVEKANPDAHGFTADEFGELYQEAANRGIITGAMTDEQVANELSRLAAPASAIKNMLADQGSTGVPVSQLMAGYDQMNDVNLTPEALDIQLRQGHELQHPGSRGGGAFGGSFAQHGSAPGGAYARSMRATGSNMQGSGSLQENAAMDQQLRQKAQHSDAGNMIAATANIAQTIGFQPGSAGEQLWQKMQTGELGQKDIDYQNWVAAMGSAGVSPSQASSILQSPGLNQRSMTDELTDSARRAQYNIDIKPQFERGNFGAGPAADMVRQGHQDSVARAMGYQQGLPQLQALHGPATRGVRGIMAQAKQRAQQASQVSHLGQAGPLRRLSTAIQTATPQTTAMEFGGKVLGGIPKSQLPVKSGAYNESIGAIAFSYWCAKRGVQQGSGSDRGSVEATSPV